MSNTNQPAFPTTQENGCNSGEPGMTLRDYFAAKAMQGLIGGDWPTAKSEQNQLALLAYSLADAMLKARDA